MTPQTLILAGTALSVFGAVFLGLAWLWHSIDQDARKAREAKLIQARAYLKAQAAALKPCDTRRGPIARQHRALTHAELVLAVQAKRASR